MSGTQELVNRIRVRADEYLATSATAGIGIGVCQDARECRVYGGRLRADSDTPPDDDTLFEIGSITKVFTTTLLAEMHIAGELDLNDPVNRYLPPHGRLECHRGDEVTLRHLATHTSGLPRLPINLTSEALCDQDPYAHYSADELYRGLAQTRLKNCPGRNTRYSNLGSGLLGHVLSIVGGDTYERLLMKRILHPLGMRQTAVHLSDDQQQQLAPGHADGKHVRNWHFEALAGAGALRSTVPDMLRFLRANLEPSATPLQQALRLTQELQTQFEWKWYGDIGCLGPLALVGLGGPLVWRSFGLPVWLRMAIPIAAAAGLLAALLSGVVPSLADMALGWHMDRLGGGDSQQRAYWHNGCTAGFASYMAFTRESPTGVVMLSNASIAPDTIGRELLNDLVS